LVIGPKSAAHRFACGNSHGGRKLKEPHPSSSSPLVTGG
jgi:hypothetical protein